MVYDFLELLPLEADGALCPVTLLRTCLGAVDAVARGSDMHLVLAVRYLAKATAKHGADSILGREAGLLCYQAHVARYGALSSDLARRMVQVWVLGGGGAGLFLAWHWTSMIGRSQAYFGWFFQGCIPCFSCRVTYADVGLGGCVLL